MSSWEFQHQPYRWEKSHHFKLLKNRWNKNVCISIELALLLYYYYYFKQKKWSKSKCRYVPRDGHDLVLTEELLYHKWKQNVRRKMVFQVLSAWIIWRRKLTERRCCAKQSAGTKNKTKRNHQQLLPKNYALTAWALPSTHSLLIFPVFYNFPLLFICFLLEDVISVKLKFFDAFTNVIERPTSKHITLKWNAHGGRKLSTT